MIKKTTITLNNWTTLTPTMMRIILMKPPPILPWLLLFCAAAASLFFPPIMLFIGIFVWVVTILGTLRRLQMPLPKHLSNQNEDQINSVLSPGVRSTSESQPMASAFLSAPAQVPITVTPALSTRASPALIEATPTSIEDEVSIIESKTTFNWENGTGYGFRGWQYATAFHKTPFQCPFALIPELVSL